MADISKEEANEEVLLTIPKILKNCEGNSLLSVLLHKANVPRGKTKA